MQEAIWVQKGAVLIFFWVLLLSPNGRWIELLRSSRNFGVNSEVTKTRVASIFGCGTLIEVFEFSESFCQCLHFQSSVY